MLKGPSDKQTVCEHLSCLVVAGVGATGWRCCGYTACTGVAGCALQLHQQHAASGRNEKVLRMEVGNPPAVVVHP